MKCYFELPKKDYDLWVEHQQERERDLLCPCPKCSKRRDKVDIKRISYIGGHWGIDIFSDPSVDRDEIEFSGQVFHSNCRSDISGDILTRPPMEGSFEAEISPEAIEYMKRIFKRIQDDETL